MFAVCHILEQFHHLLLLMNFPYTTIFQSVHESGDDVGVLAIGQHIGPPQLPDEEQEHQDAGGQQQLAEDAERAAQQAGPAAGAVAGGHHPAFAMSMVREPSKAGTVTSSRTSVRSPRPT